MGTAAAERIAIAIDSTAKLEGLASSRAAVGALGQEAKAATDAIAQGTAAAASGQGQLTISLEQGREAMKRAGGDLEKFKSELKKLTAAEAEAAEKTTAAGNNKLAQLAKAEAAAHRLDAQRTAAAQREIQTMGQLEVAAYREDAARTKALQTIEKTPPAVGKAANAMTTLATAAATGDGTLAGAARSAGALATGLAGLATSARVAAAATGIGALITVAITLVGLFRQANDEADQLARTSLSLGSLTADGLRDREAAKRRQLDAADARINNAQNRVGMGPVFIPQDWTDERNRLAKELGELTAARLSAESAAGQRLSDERKRQRDQAADERDRERKRLADERERDTATASKLNQTFTEQMLASTDQAALSKAQADENRVNRELGRTLQEIEALKITEDEKARVRVAATLAAEAEIQLIRKTAADAEKEEAAKTAAAVDKERQQSLDQLAGSVWQVAQSSMQAGDSLAKVLTKTALAPVVAELEALAKRETVKAGLHALAGDLSGAARHAGGAALAIAAAREVAGRGGLGGGGGSGAGAASGGAGLGRGFTADQLNGGGSTTVVIQTIDPRSRAVVDETSYQLQRAGVLKRPIYPPSGSGGYPSMTGAY